MRVLDRQPQVEEAKGKLGFTAKGLIEFFFSEDPHLQEDKEKQQQKEFKEDYFPFNKAGLQRMKRRFWEKDIKIINIQ